MTRHDPTDTRPGAQPWDVCVVGAGPAGATTALLLARRGRSVLLVDKQSFPRPKVCGGCLGGVGLAALSEADLAPATLGVAITPLRSVLVCCGALGARLPLGARAAVCRERLDAALLEQAVREGVRFVAGAAARVGAWENGVRTVRLGAASGERLAAPARVVVVAAGLGATGLVDDLRGAAPRRKPSGRIGAGVVVSGATAELPDGEVLMACDPRGRGYVGVVRLPDGRLDVAAAMEPGAARDAGGVAKLAKEVLGAAGFDAAGLPDNGWRATPRLTHAPDRVAARGLFLVGDAAGYVEPFTGEGIGWAIRGAVELAPIVDTAVTTRRRPVAHDWILRSHELFHRQHSRCRWVCRLVGARRATPVVVRVLAAAPWLARPLLGRLDPQPSIAHE